MDKIRRCYYLFLGSILVLNKWIYGRKIKRHRKMIQHQIETKVIAILHDILDLNNVTISNKSSLKQFGLDSLDKHDLLMEIEKEFKINYETLDQDFFYDLSIEDLCRHIESEIILKDSI